MMINVKEKNRIEWAREEEKLRYSLSRFTYTPKNCTCMYVCMCV